jgi:hypothetical protein
MARKRQPDEILLKASEHLLYELQMLFGTARLLARLEIAGESDFQDVVVYNALLESFTIHGRALLDFLYNDNPYKDDIIASDFFDPGYWLLKRPAKSPLLKTFHNDVHKRVAHLSYHRLSVKPDEVWDYMNIANEIGLVLGRFRDTTSPHGLSQTFCEFLEGVAPSYKFFPTAKSSVREEDDKFYRGGVSLMPYPGITQEDFEKFWSEVLKDLE